ncbi:MAG: Flp pilus assembly protein CpaB [Gammaproteobacteria bacterium]|nr:Flp pilus assembly protein CpaB [Gammaproteobacteria bacterium]
MFKKKGLVLIVLSFVMAVGAAWFANQYIQNSTTDDNGMTGAQVAAAAIGIPHGTKIEARHVTMVNMEEGSIPSGAVRTLEDVEGMIANAEILAGELLLSGRFVKHISGSTLSALVEEKKRAFTVRVDDVIGVAGFLLPGNYVDVLATRMVRSTQRAVSETIIRNVKVLAVDQTARTDESDPVVVRAVTIEITPKQAEILVARKEEGTIQLTLRNPLDDAVPVVAKAAPKAAPKRVYRPSTTKTITIIKGTKVSQNKVNN